MMRTKEVIMMRMDGARARMVIRKSIWRVTATSAGFFVSENDIDSLGSTCAQRETAERRRPSKTGGNFLKEKISLKLFPALADNDSGRVFIIVFLK